MKTLGLFSGVGGFELGLQRAGFEIVAMCELEPFCVTTLFRHFAGVPIYNDVRELTAERLAADGIAVEVICGGFPCQDISWAGQGAGLYGERSGLWRDYARLIRDLRPKYAIMENSAALLSRGFGDFLGDLAEIGYDAEWHCISAADLGAPHSRERVWVVAYPEGERPGQVRWLGSAAESEGIRDIHWPKHEPPSQRVAFGLPKELDDEREAAVCALGNALVPQIAEMIGRAILQAHGLKSARAEYGIDTLKDPSDGDSNG